MSILSKLQEKFPDLVWQADADLASHTYMRVGGPAEVLWVADDLEVMIEVILFARQEKMPLLVIGGASNLIIQDGGVDGLVIINHCLGGDHFLTVEAVQDVLPLDNSYFRHAQPHAQYVLSHSGVKTALLVGQTVQLKLSGLEPFVGVPGSIGGAVYNNSHYEHELIGDWVVAVEVLDEQSNRVWLHQQECAFAYDESRFQHTNEIILQALFFVLPDDPALIQTRILESTMKRAGTQPIGTANSGCIFKNVELTPEQSANFEGKTKVSAGWLIDKAGLKGARVGGAVVSSVHANFIVNDGQATCADIQALIRHIQKTVQQKFDVQLESEVFFLGKEKE
jgi:UDP-N-acetylmuramate dehydrogenase